MISTYDNYTIPKLPDDITLPILGKLDNLMDVRSFGSTSHTAQIFTQIIWLEWANSFGYTGTKEESAKYLTDFFSRIAKIATLDSFPRCLKLSNPHDGYRTALNVLNSSQSTIKELLCFEWTFKHPEILILIKQVAGTSFKQMLVTHPDTNTLLICAAKYGHIDIIQIIGEENKKNLANFGHLPIQAATKAGQGASIKALSAYGMDINSEWTELNRKKTVTPLQFACENSISNAAIALLQAGAYSETEFLTICAKADLCMLKIFLEFAPCNVTGGLSLCFASRNKQANAFACMELLLKNKANPNIVNCQGETYLHQLISEANIDYVRLFCSYGANVELRNIKGKSPLYIVIKSKKIKKLEMARTLCDHGANMLALGPKGQRTLYEHAANQKEMTALLKDIQMKRMKTL